MCKFSEIILYTFFSAFYNKSEPMFKEFIETKKTKTNLILSSKNIKLEKIITLINNLN